MPTTTPYITASPGLMMASTVINSPKWRRGVEVERRDQIWDNADYCSTLTMGKYISDGEGEVFIAVRKSIWPCYADSDLHGVWPLRHPYYRGRRNIAK